MKVTNYVLLLVLILFTSCTLSSHKKVVERSDSTLIETNLEQKYSIDKKSIIVDNRDQVDLAMRELMLLNGYDIMDFRHNDQLKSGKSVNNDDSYFIGSLVCEDIVNIRMFIVEASPNTYSIHTFLDRKRNNEDRTLNWTHNSISMMGLAKGIKGRDLNRAIEQVLNNYGVTMKNLEDDNSHTLTDLCSNKEVGVREMQFVKTTTSLLLLYKLPGDKYKVEFMVK